MNILPTLREVNLMLNNQFKRHRRLRTSPAMRSLVRETHVTVDDLIYPLFVVEGDNIKNEVPSMPGVFQLSLDYLADEMKEIKAIGIKSVMHFVVPEDLKSVV